MVSTAYHPCSLTGAVWRRSWTWKGYRRVSASRGTGRKRSIGPIRNLLSLALFGVAAVLFIVVAVMYIREDDNKNDAPPTPASIPGKAQLKNVFDALAAQDIKVDYIRGGLNSTIRITDGTPPGQGLTVDGHPLYAFIFESPADRESQTSDFTEDDLVAAAIGVNGTPVADGAPHSVGGSNIFAVVYGGDDDLNAKVDAAIKGIP